MLNVTADGGLNSEFQIAAEIKVTTSFKFKMYFEFVLFLFNFNYAQEAETYSRNTRSNYLKAR